MRSSMAETSRAAGRAPPPLVWAVALLVATVLAPCALGAQAAGPGPPQTVTVVPGPQYRAGWPHRLFLGAHYRDLWTIPIDVPVLDVERFAGGLTPVRRGGGRQTKSLHFDGDDGRRYAFRSLDKDPTLALPKELRESLVDNVLQDQISAQHPAAALVVAPLLDAAGVLHTQPQLFVLPDDPRLGEFRAEFAGMLGTIEPRADEAEGGEPGFAGSSDVVGTLKMFERREADPRHRVQARAYLLARLMDIFVGDWDRHLDQWRWAGFARDGGVAWYPVPEDRDQAFARMDGVLLWVARWFLPQLVGFGPDYPSLLGLTWSAKELDRRLLAELEWPAWDSVAASLEARLTDSVIEAAVRRMPAEMYPANGAELTFQLKRRRDGLRAAARSAYALLAHVVDIHASDAAERVAVHAVDERYVDIRAEAKGEVAFRRRFDRRETAELRLYLHGGDDEVLITGSASNGMVVRVVGGGGDDVLTDSTQGRWVVRTYLYDDRGDNEFVRGPNTKVDTRSPHPRPEAEAFAPPGRSDEAPIGLGQRDWGHRWLPLPWLTFDPDLGAFVGAGTIGYTYGFRRLPYQARVRARAGFATGPRRIRFEFEAEVPQLAAGLAGALRLRFSGIDIIHFHGFGNETAAPGPAEFYKARQQVLEAEPWLTAAPTPGLELSFGPTLRLGHSDLQAGTLIAQALPYGVDSVGVFTQAGVRARLELDLRDRPVAARRGVLVRAHGRYFPGMFSVEEPFGGLRAEAATYLSPRVGGDPTLALRVGGEKVWGRFPFHEAAYLGGGEALRGFRKQRFAGDASLYGNAELRVTVTDIYVGLPGAFGVFALVDAGRVFLSGETSTRWHAAGGGGIWFAFLDRANTVSLGAVRSREGLGVYARAGFPF